MSVADYTSKRKDICDSLASIDVNVEEGEMVQICLGGPASKFKSFRIGVCTRENTPSFFRLTIDPHFRGEPRRCADEHARRHQDVVHGGR